MERTSINNGLSQNAMGLRASDCAAVQGRDSTAEFLLMFETSLGITRELLARERQQDQVSTAVTV